MENSRRKFIKTSLLSGFGALVLSSLPMEGLSNVISNFDPLDIDNPLGKYPNRDWEKTYRDLWKYDDE
nr:hypothetical protein [Chitinophagaceae bacterium]